MKFESAPVPLNQQQSTFCSLRFFVVNLSFPTIWAVIRFPRLPRRRLHVSRACDWHEGKVSSSIRDWLIITSASPYTVTGSVLQQALGKAPKMPSSSSRVLVWYSRKKNIRHLKLNTFSASHFQNASSRVSFVNDRLHPGSRCTIVNVSSVYLRLVCFVLFVPQVSI